MGVNEFAEDRLAPVRTGRRPARLLTSSEVARIFSVDPKTVSRWAIEGRIPYLRTPGGHRRFDEADVRRWIEKHS